MSFRSQLLAQFVVGLGLVALSLYLVPTIALQGWAFWVAYVLGLPAFLLGVFGLGCVWEAVAEFCADMRQGGAK